MKLDIKLAVGVGEYFAIVNREDVRHIALKATSTVLVVDGEAYVLNKGTTFEESQKVDALFDSGKYTELAINQHKA